jgi:hypothetical protein
MSQNAAIEYPSKEDAFVPDMLRLPEDDPGSGSSSRIRYRAGFVKPPSKRESEPDFGTAAGTVAQLVPRRSFVSPAVWRPPAPAKERFVALQRWEGIVTECRTETFLARLSDLTADGVEEEIELPLSDIAEEDLSLVALGAVFYWSIGYRIDAGGQRWRASTLRFRRLPVWSAAEIEQAKARASDVARTLGAN